MSESLGAVSLFRTWHWSRSSYKQMASLMMLLSTSFLMHALVFLVTVEYALQVLEQLDSCLEEAGIGRANLTEVGPPRCMFSVLPLQLAGTTFNLCNGIIWHYNISHMVSGADQGQLTIVPLPQCQCFTALPMRLKVVSN